MEKEEGKTKPQLEDKDLKIKDPVLTDIKAKKGSSQTLIYFLLALSFMFIGALGLWLYQQTTQVNKQIVINHKKSEQLKNEKSVNTSQEQKDINTTTTPTTTTTTTTPNSLQNKVFYKKDNNIFVYDIDSKKASKLTNYPENASNSPAYDENNREKPLISIKNIRVIDEKNLGFSKCGTIKGDYGCGLYVLNLDTKQIIEKKKFDKDDYIEDVGWYDTDTFAYLLTTDNTWQLYLNTKHGLKTLEDFTMNTYGRGGYIEDSEKIKFSPNGKHFLQIATASPRNSFDFNVYIYNIDAEIKTVIQNATQPEWINNNEIVFRKLTKKGGDGLYTYNVKDQTQKKLQGVGDDSYNPTVLSNKILYEKNSDKQQIWMYDLTNNTNKLIVDNAVFPNWLNSEKIIFQKIESCKGKEDKEEICGGPFNYEIKYLTVYDLSKKTEIETTSDFKSLFYNITTQYN